MKGRGKIEQENRRKSLWNSVLSVVKTLNLKWIGTDEGVRITSGWVRRVGVGGLSLDR